MSAVESFHSSSPKDNLNYKHIYRIKYITNAPSNTAVREHFSSVEKVDLNFLKLKRKISLKRR